MQMHLPILRQLISSPKMSSSVLTKHSLAFISFAVMISVLVFLRKLLAFKSRKRIDTFGGDCQS